MRINIISALTLILLSGCTSVAGPQFAPQKPEKGMAKLVVYRPEGSIIMSGRGAPSIKVNGMAKCNIDDGRYFSLDMPAGKTDLSTRLIGDVYTSTYSLNTKPNTINYVKVQFNDPAVYGQIAGGVIASSMVSQEGTFLFRDGNEAEARLTFETCH